MYYNLFIYFNIIIIFPINFVPLLRMYNNVYSNGFVLGWDILIRSDPCTLYLTSGLYSSSFPLWRKNSLQSLTQKCSPDMPAGLAVLAQSLFTVSSTYIFINLCDMASLTHSFLSFLWHLLFCWKVGEHWSTQANRRFRELVSSSNKLRIHFSDGIRGKLYIRLVKLKVRWKRIT